MAIETKDVLGWLITGGLGASGLILNLLTRRDAKRKASREAEAIWSLEPIGGQARDAPGKLFRLKLEDVRTNRVRLSDVQAVEPRGVLLALVDYGSERDVNDGEVPGIFVDRIAFDQDIQGSIGIGGQPSTTFGFVHFFANWPSATDRKCRSRLVVKITFELISASRRESRLTVSSQPIEWMPSAPARAR